MNAQDPGARLHAGLSALKLDAALADPLLAYLQELLKWNRAYNLTAVREPAEIVTRHFLDSLALLPYLPESRVPSPESRLIDIGTGPGLPGIPLALARPQLAVTLLDSNGKKVRFLRHVQRALGLDNIEIVEARAEHFQPPQPYGRVVSRAYAALGDFLRTTAHLGGADGQWLAMKGKLADRELGELPEGFQVDEVIALQVPGLNEARHLVRAGRRA